MLRQLEVSLAAVVCLRRRSQRALTKSGVLAGQQADEETADGTHADNASEILGDDAIWKAEQNPESKTNRPPVCGEL